MTVRDTSLEAYATVKITEAQKKVLGVFRTIEKPLCNSQVAYYLEWPINRITPRVLELRNMGILVEAGKKKVNGRNVHLWKCRDLIKETLWE